MLCLLGIVTASGGVPVITSCGTGVTASVIALALELIGHKNWAIYDGAWSEYAVQKNADIRKQ